MQRLCGAGSPPASGLRESALRIPLQVPQEERPLLRMATRTLPCAPTRKLRSAWLPLPLAAAAAPHTAGDVKPGAITGSPGVLMVQVRYGQRLSFSESAVRYSRLAA